MRYGHTPIPHIEEPKLNQVCLDLLVRFYTIRRVLHNHPLGISTELPLPRQADDGGSHFLPRVLHDVGRQPGTSLDKLHEPEDYAVDGSD